MPGRAATHAAGSPALTERGRKAETYLRAHRPDQAPSDRGRDSALRWLRCNRCGVILDQHQQPNRPCAVFFVRSCLTFRWAWDGAVAVICASKRRGCFAWGLLRTIQPQGARRRKMCTQECTQKAAVRGHARHRMCSKLHSTYKFRILSEISKGITPHHPYARTR